MKVSLDGVTKPAWFASVPLEWIKVGMFMYSETFAISQRPLCSSCLRNEREIPAVRVERGVGIRLRVKVLLGKG